MYFAWFVLLVLESPFVKAMVAPLIARQGRGAQRSKSWHGSYGLLRMNATPSPSLPSPFLSSSFGSYSWPRGNVLAVGEGDFTFSALLVAHARARGDLFQGVGSESAHVPSSAQPFQLLATTLDAAVDLPRLYPTSVETALAKLEAAATSSSLPRGAIAVAYGVDATLLEASPEVTARAPYDVIRFNFPHVKGKSNSKANRALLSAFLSSARPLIKDNGVVEVALAEGQGGTGACGERRIGWVADQKRALGLSSGVHKSASERDFERAEKDLSDVSLTNRVLPGSNDGSFSPFYRSSVEDAQLMWTRSWQASSCGAEAGLILAHVEPFEAAVVANDGDDDGTSLRKEIIEDNGGNGNGRYVPSGRRGRSLGFSPGETPLLHRFISAATLSDQDMEAGAAGTNKVAFNDESKLKAPSLFTSSDVRSSVCESTAALALQHRYCAELHVAVPLDWCDDDILEEAIRAYLRTKSAQPSASSSMNGDQQPSPDSISETRSGLNCNAISVSSINNNLNFTCSAENDFNTNEALDGWSGLACAEALVRFNAIHDYVRESSQIASQHNGANIVRRNSSSRDNGDGASSPDTACSVLNRYRAFAVEFQSTAQPLSKAAAEALWAHVRIAATEFGSHADLSSSGNSGKGKYSLRESPRLVLRKKSYFGVSKPLPPYLPMDHRMGGAPSASWVPAETVTK